MTMHVLILCESLLIVGMSADWQLVFKVRTEIKGHGVQNAEFLKF